MKVLAKVTLKGEVESAEPIPARLLFSGLVMPLSTTVRAPVCGPTVVGLKVTETAQELPTLSVVPQVLALMAKGPVTVSLVKVRVLV